MVTKNKYSAKTLEEDFKTVARVRIRGKERGKQEYAGDAGYWTGGRCEWGGSHNLKEDCETLARLFDKLAGLKEAKKKLTNSANEEQFNSTKKQLVSECEQITNSLNQQTSHSYIAGVCIIWSDFKSHVDSLKIGFISTVETLKRDIGKTPYNEAKELRALEIEESQIKQEIEDNQRKASSETDPTRKRHFLLLVDEGRAKWKKIIEKKKKLKITNLGDDYDSDKFIENFIKGIKNKIEGNPPPQNPFETPDKNDSGGSGSGTGRKTTPLDPFQTDPNSNPNQNFFQNKQLVIVAGIALFIIFYLLNQKQEKEPNYYDF